MSTRLTRRQRQALERREQLVDVALSVFADKGFRGASVKELSEAAGVAQGLFYHYFEGKEALLLAAVEGRGFLPEMRRVLGTSGALPARDVLAEVLEGFYELLRSNEKLVAVFFGESRTNPKVGERLQQMIGEGVGLLSRYLRERVEAGELRPHDAEVTARSLLYTVFMLHLTRVPSRPFVPELIETTLRGTLAQPGE